MQTHIHGEKNPSIHERWHYNIPLQPFCEGIVTNELQKKDYVNVCYQPKSIAKLRENTCIVGKGTS